MRFRNGWKITSLVAGLFLLGCAATALGAEERPLPHFPPEKLAPGDPGRDEFINAWFSRHLAAMGEPRLAPTPDTRVYRFTWLRTFHHPVAVRLTASEGRATLHAVELDGAGGYEPGKILRKAARNLSAAEFAEMENLIHQAGFWGMAARKGEGGFDGSEWIIEGVAGNRYHVVVRWSPDSGPVRKLGKKFLSLAGWKFKQDEMY